MKLHKNRSNSQSTIFLCFMILLWLLLIYTLSTQNGPTTANTSSGLAIRIAKVVYGMPNADQIDHTHIMIRKAAHVALFGVLGILAGILCVKEKRISIPSNRFFMAYLCLLLYLFLDEWHKQFIEGRHKEIIDMLLNMAGSTIGLGLVALIHYLYTNAKKNKQNSQVGEHSF